MKKADIKLLQGLQVYIQCGTATPCQYQGSQEINKHAPAYPLKS